MTTRTRRDRRAWELIYPPPPPPSCKQAGCSTLRTCTCTGDRPDALSRHTIGAPGATWKGLWLGRVRVRVHQVPRGRGLWLGRVRVRVHQVPRGRGLWMGRVRVFRACTSHSHNPARGCRVAVSSRTARRTRVTSTRCASTSRRTSATWSSLAVAPGALVHLRMVRSLRCEA